MQDEMDCVALVNEEGQYCVWPEQKPVPPGWRATGPIGVRREVMEWIEERWRDLTPASLRQSRPPEVSA